MKEVENNEVIGKSFYTTVRDAYPNNYDGLWQMFQNLGIKTTMHRIEAGEERKLYERYVKDDDPLKDRKLDYLLWLSGAASKKVDVDQNFLVSMNSTVDQQIYLDAVVDKLEATGRRLEDITVDEFYKMCGRLDGLSKSTDKFKVTERHMNLLDATKAHLIAKNKEPNVAEINSYLRDVAKKEFTKAAFFSGQNKYLKTLGEDKTEPLKIGTKLTDNKFASDFTKLKQDDMTFKNWANNEALEICDEITNKNALENIRKINILYRTDTIREDLPLDFATNAAKIKSMLKRLDDNTHWYKGGSSKNFDKMFTAFEELTKYAKKLSSLNRKPLDTEIEEYVKLATNVNNLAAYYLDNKKPSTSSYAATRVALVKEVKKNIVENIAQFNAFYIDKYEKEDVRLYNENAREIESTYDKYVKNNNKANDYLFTSADVRKVYSGKNYTKETLEKAKAGSFSITRSAAYSMAMLELLIETDNNGNNKYSYDDVMDITKLNDEKSQKFDAIVKKMAEAGSSDKKVAEDARKWFADLIFKEQMASIKIMDEQLAKMGTIDITLPESDEMLKLRALSSAMFDLWQEMGHCKDEIIELARKNKIIGNNGTYVDYSGYLMALNGPLPVYNTAVIGIPSHVNNYKVARTYAKPLIAKKIAETLTVNYINEWLNTDRKIPYSKWVSDNECAKALNGNYDAALDYVQLFDDCQDVEFLQYVMDNIVSDNIFRNIKYNPAKANELGDLNTYDRDDTIENGKYDCLRGGAYTGYPTVAELLEDYKVHKMDATNVVKEFDKVSAKIEKDAPKFNEDKSALAIYRAAIEGIRTLSNLIIEERPMSGYYLEDANRAIRYIVSYSFMKEFKKLGIKGNELSAAVSEAMKYSDEFKKNTAYVGKKAVFDFAFTDIANDIVKKSSKSIFMGKARASLERLKGNMYADTKNLIKDAAYAFTAQILRVHGELKDPKTNTVVSPDKYVEKLISSKKFKNSLKSDPDTYMQPRDIAVKAVDDVAFKKANEAANAHTAANNANAHNAANNAPEVNNAHKKTNVTNKKVVKK